MRSFSIIILLVLTFSMVSCIGTTQNKQAPDEVAVFNELFMALIDTMAYNEPLPIPPMLFDDSTREDSLAFKQDSIDYANRLSRRLPDTSELKVFLINALCAFPNNEPIKDHMEYLLDTAVFTRNVQLDASWLPLVQQLVQIRESIQFDLEAITNTGRYVLVDERAYFDKELRGRKVGIVLMSRIAFNEDQERGVFYYSFLCGGECGHGSLYFIEKHAGVWEIVGSEMMWVA